MRFRQPILALALCAACAGAQVREEAAVLELLYGCGLRASEACNLEITSYEAPAGRLRVVGKDSQGRLVNKTIGTVFKDRGDAYVQECSMK